MNRIGRLSLAFLGLVIVPWTICGATYLAYRSCAPSILYNRSDLIELRSIGYALKSYRLRHGEYPPDFSSGDPKQEIDDHLSRLFPNRDLEADSLRSYSQLGPRNALYFWLQGFSKNPETPLTGIDRGFSPFYKFDIGRMIQQSYYPIDGKAPIVYFRGGTENYEQARTTLLRSTFGVVRPYKIKDEHGHVRFAAVESFQLINAGIDGNFGSDATATSSLLLGAGADNLTNFSEWPMGTQLLAERRENLSRTFALSFCCAIAGLASYPLVFYLRQRRDGITLLRRLVKTTTASGVSESWRQVLTNEKVKNRANAMDRMAARTASNQADS